MGRGVGKGLTTRKREKRRELLRLDREFLSTVPPSPGVYRMWNDADRLIYVGKAKNLRRRLSQYANPGRTRKCRRMRSILKDAARVEFETAPDHLSACLLETRLIQQHRPRWNLVGAFSFLYPMIGVREREGEVDFCLTTLPEQFDGFRWHGAFRSRSNVTESFHSWMTLLEYVVPRRRERRKGGRAADATRVKYSTLRTFRGIRAEDLALMEEFLKGKSGEYLETLMMALIENAAARRRATEIQDHIDALKRFWVHEAVRLRRAIGDSGEWPVRQQDRDPVFIAAREAREAREAGKL